MRKRKSAWISEWNPEDEKFWKSTGKFIARRNLIWSIFAEHLGFSIWLIWSIDATTFPQVGFHYSTDQLFQLVALPGLIGSLMRFPYTFAADAATAPDLIGIRRGHRDRRACSHSRLKALDLVATRVGCKE